MGRGHVARGETRVPPVGPLPEAGSRESRSRAQPGKARLRGAQARARARPRPPAPGGDPGDGAGSRSRCEGISRGAEGAPQTSPHRRAQPRGRRCLHVGSRGSPASGFSPTRSAISSLSSGSLFSGVKVDRRARVRRFSASQPFVGQRVDGPFARLARLLTRGEVAELRESFRLDVVLAFARPGEHPPSPRQAQEIVGARSGAAHQARGSRTRRGSIRCLTYYGS